MSRQTTFTFIKTVHLVERAPETIHRFRTRYLPSHAQLSDQASKLFLVPVIFAEERHEH